MNIENTRRILFTLGALCWALSGTSSNWHAGIPKNLFSYASYAGSAFLLGALALTAVKVWENRKIRKERFSAARATRRDISALIEFSRTILPASPTEDQLTKLFKANQFIFYFIEERTFLPFRSESKIVGFFSLAPLTAKAIPFLKANKLEALNIDRTHIAAPGAPSEAAYIGGIGAKGYSARRWAVNYMQARLDTLFAGGCRLVFTRPITTQGLDLVDRFGFLPAVPHQRGINNIYVLCRDDTDPESYRVVRKTRKSYVPIRAPVSNDDELPSQNPAVTLQ